MLASPLFSSPTSAYVELSVVIPIYNEEATIGELHRRLTTLSLLSWQPATQSMCAT
jgi:hypothetical protein